MAELSGRELDIQVARAIGREILWVEADEDECGHFTSDREWLDEDWLDVAENKAVARYSTDANAALVAYAVMRERGWTLVYAEDLKIQPPWRVILAAVHHGLTEVLGDGSTFAEALALAIVAASKA